MPNAGVESSATGSDATGMNVFFTKLLHSRRNQTIADQIIVSGSNFATGIILVRGLGLEQFGVFTVAYALLLLANSIQLSFICSPMITLAALSEDGAARTRYLRGMFGVQLRFCAIATVATAIVSGVFLWIKPQFGGVRLLPAFLLSVVFYLMQDWLRRYYFAAGKSQHSVWNDVVSYIGQTILLLGLWFTHRLTVNTAFWSIAVTSAAALVMGLAIERIGYSREEMRESWRRSKGLSRDLAVANQVQWVVYQGAMLIGAAVLGAEAAGSVRATQNVVGPVNVAYQAMENIVPLKAGEEMRRGGIQQVEKFLLRFGSQGFVMLAALFLCIGLFSRSFLSFFYGHKVAVYGGVLDLQLVYFLLFWPLRQYSYLFRTINRTSALLNSSVFAALTSLALIYPCVRAFQAMGIMVAAVAGQSVNLLYLIVVWMQIRSSLTNGEQGTGHERRFAVSKAE
jgi:O-antigen/teichoic acid export membrane protein